MPKHNIDAIAHATIAAHEAYNRHSGAVAPEGSAGEPTPELVAAVRVRVLETIHGEAKDDSKESPEVRRSNRLFTAIVKALTVRL